MTPPNLNGFCQILFGSEVFCICLGMLYSSKSLVNQCIYKNWTVFVWFCSVPKFLHLFLEINKTTKAHKISQFPWCKNTKAPYFSMVWALFFMIMQNTRTWAWFFPSPKSVSSRWVTVAEGMSEKRLKFSW